MANHGSIDQMVSLAVNGTVQDVSNMPTYIANFTALAETAAITYIQIFWDAAASVTVGTTVPDVVIALPASGGVALNFEGEGWKTRGTAWSIASTTTRAGAGTLASSVTIWKKN